MGKIPWRWAGQPTPVFLPGESHGQGCLAGYSPWGRKESDTTERLSRLRTLTPDAQSASELLSTSPVHFSGRFFCLVVSVQLRVYGLFRALVDCVCVREISMNCLSVVFFVAC